MLCCVQCTDRYGSWSQKAFIWSKWVGGCSAIGDFGTSSVFSSWFSSHHGIQLQKGIACARSDDTRGLKGSILDWIVPQGEVLSPPLFRNVKHDRGFHHERTGFLLCPAEYDWSQEKFVCLPLYWFYSDLVLVVSESRNSFEAGSSLFLEIFGQTFFIIGSNAILQTYGLDFSAVPSWSQYVSVILITSGKLYAYYCRHISSSSLRQARLKERVKLLGQGKLVYTEWPRSHCLP